MSTAGAPRNSSDPPLLVAIVGSGPSGFYAADALLKSGRAVNITLLERLPSPYGLVRSGVAPDHPKLKQVITVYARLAEDVRISYIGNVTVGRDLSVAALRRTHHAVILACGAEADRRLGIAGEELPGSHTATEFVGWYNGHPDYRDRQFDLSCETAVIIGQGNVAADVGRILAKSIDELKHTDMAQHALEALAMSKIKQIHIIGRRGPAQAKFTSKELKEFGNLAVCDPVIAADELQLNPESEAELADQTNAGQRKVVELFKQFSQYSASKPRHCRFSFLQSPVAFTGDGRVQQIVLERNRLAGKPFAQTARGSGTRHTLTAGIVFRSIGYRGLAMPGVPFDEGRGVFANARGRIHDGGAIVHGLYVAGWIKRGASGIIGTNRADSAETVGCLLEDAGALCKLDNEAKTGAEGCYAILDQRGVRYVSFNDWKKIDAGEQASGQAQGKPREKYTRIAEMLALLD